MDANELVRCGFCFVSGMLVGALRDRIAIVQWAWIPIAVLLILSHQTSMQYWALLLLIPYGAISFASCALPYVSRAGRFGDPSYGIYIYAFMVQQSLMHWAPHASIPEFLFLATVISAAAGYVSCHLIEKHAIKFRGFLTPRIDRRSAQSRR